MQRRIDAGELEDGRRLPPRRELEGLRELPVNASTLNAAFAILRRLRYVETRRGRSGGTYVIGPERRKEMPAPHT